MLVLNTWWNLRAFQRDMDFAVREKALGIQRSMTVWLASQAIDEAVLTEQLVAIAAQEPAIVSLSVMARQPTGVLAVVATTNNAYTEGDEKLVLNEMAAQQDEPFFTKTYDQFSAQNVWVAVAPFGDEDSAARGLLNLKVSGEVVESIVNRTSRDAMIILMVSIGLVVLLLVNHLHFFERALLVDKLKQIDQMKDDFISVASHELKTPLTAIAGCVMMLKKLPLAKEASEWVVMIDDSVSRLKELVNDLLNVSRIEQNRMDFVLTKVNSTEVVGAVIRQLTFTAQQKNLALAYEPENPPVLIMANGERYREVLVNLVGNAIKYTLKGGVRVYHTVEEKTVKLVVQDSGVGIAPENKEKLFTKFTRLYDEKTRDVPGTGLGLWITKEMVERMGGKIYVDSIVGQGTVFTVVLSRAV